MMETTLPFHEHLMNTGEGNRTLHMKRAHKAASAARSQLRYGMLRTHYDY